MQSEHCDCERRISLAEEQTLHPRQIRRMVDDVASVDLIFDLSSSMYKSATEKELDLYCKTREGEAKLSRAAQKLREKAEFAWQMDRDAGKKGMAKMSKSEAKAQARLDLKTELYMRNVNKV